MLSRPPSSPAIAILKPSPSSPIRFADRHAAILEHHHRGRLRLPAELLLLRAEREPRRALLDHDAGNALRPGAAGAHHADVDVGDAAAGDEGLGAVEHVMIAVAHGARLQARGVRAGVRLGQAIAREMLHGAELRQELLALRVAAEGVDHPGRHVVDRDIGGGRGAALRQFLEDDARRRAATAPSRRRRPSHRCRRSRARRPCAASRPGRSRSRPSRARCGIISSRRELPRGGLEGALVLGEVEIHVPRRPA